MRELLATSALTLCLSSPALAQSTWTGPGGLGGAGFWNVAGNWTPAGVPNAVGAEVIFNQVAPPGFAGIDLVGGTFTIGTLRVNSPSPYVIGSSGLSAVLNFEVAAGNALIEVTQSSATQPFFVRAADGGNPITVNLVSNTEANVAAGQLLWFGDETVLAGAGQLNVIGAGTVRIDAASTRTGTTVMSAGTLVIGNVGALGSGAVNFNAGVLRSNVSGTLANDITALAGGTSTVAVADGQTLTLTGTLTAAPGAAEMRFGQAGTGTIVAASNTVGIGGGGFIVVIGGGTVQGTGTALGSLTTAAVQTGIAAGAVYEHLNTTVLSSGIRNLLSFGTLRLGAGVVMQIGSGTSVGTIDGPGALVLAAPGSFAFGNSGVLILGSAATHTGGTTMQAGTTLLVGIGTGGSIAGNIANNGGTLLFARTDTYQYDGAISGTGIVGQSGTGTLILTGASTYTGGTGISIGGTLMLGNGGTTGSIVGPVLNGGTLAFNRSNTYQFDGVISGTGALSQIGSGTTVLTAANTYTGATTVTAGTLLVNGSIATSSGLTVAAGATVGGIGTLPTSVVGGTLAPGNSIGTINVAGNLTFSGTGVHLVEVGTTTADRTNVTGTANLAGTLRLVSAGQPLSFFTRYTLINAAGGVNGTFASTENLLGASIRTTVSYDANNVFLTLDPNALLPLLAGTPVTQNQLAVATAFDRAVANGADPSAFLPLFLVPTASLSAALDQLSGEVHTGTHGLGVLVSGQFLQAMLDQNAFGRTPRGILAYAPSGALAGLPGVVAATQAADLPAEIEVIDTRRFAVWGAVFGSDGRVSGDAVIGSARRHGRNFGLAAGVDVRVAPGTIVGVALAGGGADASVNGRGSLEADAFQAGLYAMTRFGSLDLRAALAYSHLDIDSSRSIPVLGIPTLTANYEAEVWSGRLEAAVPLTAFAGLSIAPVAALQVQSVRIDGFTETTPGGPLAAALTVAGRTSTTSRGELGLRFETRFGAPGFDATAFARVAWGHYFERDASINAAFVGLAGSNFTVIGARPDRDAALISAGVDVRLTPQLSIGARFDGEFSENVNQYAGTARVRFEF